MASDRFAEFVAPARRAPAVWRLALGLLVMGAVFAIWLGVMLGLLVLWLGLEEGVGAFTRMATPHTPASVFLLLTTFLGMAAAPLVAARLLHKRRARTVFGPRPRVLAHFAISALAVVVIYAGSMWLWGLRFDPVPNLPLGLWAALLPLSLLAVALQTGAEELVFRGYLMQQLAARFPYAVVYILVPSAAFGILHYDPSTMGTNAWAVVGATAFFGLVAADLTRTTGSIGAAWGVHFANNVVAILIVATQNTITGLALFTTPYAAAETAITGPLLMLDMTILILVWGGLRMLLRG